MKLCTFSSGGERRLGVAPDGQDLIDVEAAASALGESPPVEGGMLALLEAGAPALDALRGLVGAAGDHAEAPWRYRLEDVTLHCPYRPRKNVIRAGNNGRTMCGAPKDAPGVELPPGRWLKGFPIRYYTKAPSAVLDPGEPVSWPEDVTSQVYAEPQLAIVIGETLEYVTSEQARSRIGGYAVATDVSSHDLKLKHGQWPKAVSLDSFLPWGPFVVTSDEIADPDALDVTLSLNGEESVSGSTSDALLGVGEMLAEISFGIRLDPGDVLLLGAPECVGFGEDPARWLSDGDTVTSSIDGIGSLTNPVAPYER